MTAARVVSRCLSSDQDHHRPLEAFEAADRVAQDHVVGRRWTRSRGEAEVVPGIVVRPGSRGPRCRNAPLRARRPTPRADAPSGPRCPRAHALVDAKPMQHPAQRLDASRRRSAASISSGGRPSDRSASAARPSPANRGTTSWIGWALRQFVVERVLGSPSCARRRRGRSPGPGRGRRTARLPRRRSAARRATPASRPRSPGPRRRRSRGTAARARSTASSSARGSVSSNQSGGTGSRLRAASDAGLATEVLAQLVERLDVSEPGRGAVASSSSASIRASGELKHTSRVRKPSRASRRAFSTASIVLPVPAPPTIARPSDASQQVERADLAVGQLDDLALALDELVAQHRLELDRRGHRSRAAARSPFSPGARVPGRAASTPRSAARARPAGPPRRRRPGRNVDWSSDEIRCPHRALAGRADRRTCRGPRPERRRHGRRSA